MLRYFDRHCFKTVSILYSKLKEIVNLCKDWVSKTYSSKRDLQCLLGSLLYIFKCVKPARVFLNKILAVFCQNHNNTKILLSSDFFKDCLTHFSCHIMG